MLLRNGGYYGNCTEQLAQVLRYVAVTRAGGDAVSLPRPGPTMPPWRLRAQRRRVRERDVRAERRTTFGFADYAAELSRQAGEEIRYDVLSAEAFTAIPTGAGYPGWSPRS
ncbi:hypothetical protein [Streptomyces sp. B21-083]|uniref:hypothetical protein n=1 Tax=Streptomyces sp. B21-083 TaxID=3039410 RepID=UPI002FF0FC23